jgi:Ca-activated chloride channel family protein
MRPVVAAIASLVLVGLAFSCSSAREDPSPLTLPTAAIGLCDGSGAKKECASPGSCAGAGGGGAGGFSGGINSGTGGSSGTAGSAGSTGSAGGAGGSRAGSGGGGGSAGSAGGAGSAGVADAGSSDAGCDAGAEAGANACDDAGIGIDAAAQWSQPQVMPHSCEGLDAATPAKLFLSADDSSSMAAPVIARRTIRSGGTLPPHVVRPYEFFNYYDFDFEPAAVGSVRIVPQLSSCPAGEELAFQVALQAEARDHASRRPLNLTFVLDTSGSMASPPSGGGPLPIELERAAVLAIASRLRAGDVVSMVTWSVDQSDILVGHAVSGPNDPALVTAANALAANGGTNLHAGLTRGYELAVAQREATRINRVVLISDGQANVGITDKELIAGYADDEEGEEGIYLAGVGVGDGVNDTLMNAVTDAGRGAYVYLDSVAEAQRMLGDRLLQVVDVAARAVRLEVTLPWYLAVHKFYGEQISTDPAKVRPQHLGPNDAMLFFQTLRACDPALVRGSHRVLIRATWETPLTRESRSAIIDTTINALGAGHASLSKAAAVAAYAEALRAGATEPTAEGKLAAIDRAIDAVTHAAGAGGDPDLIEIAELLDLYRARWAE